jgi:SAM-dependent methyltransferase
MVMEVLQDKLEINRARQELIEKGASLVSSPITAFLRRIGLAHGINVGDKLKSWDVLSILNFIGAHVQKNEPILDIGCYGSEVIVALHKLGHTNLTGADLNSRINQMPYMDSIRYEVVNFMQTKFEDASFKAITSISVIEHGFDGQALLKEMSRLLKSGGYFIASFDYWPEKIDTTGVKFFGMDWRIFSRQDVADFIEQARGYGLAPVGELHYSGQEPTIEYKERKYTFGWLALEKKN